eukprot:CAMPEP_0202811090 /NCGR_PEP_ID=MMETSP1389-20130828/3042_1 /ASSEMBLY_ACC=CAM_ASM_000865 /TAXON_ID=302021 /ORGANISM="Rhodomonas sp., Strain CCMP768" /LENGTH=39 /DNA_ID= /DNA_START= /DNA_END= /DNA_ORIENTATION=
MLIDAASVTDFSTPKPATPLDFNTLSAFAELIAFTQFSR